MRKWIGILLIAIGIGGLYMSLTKSWNFEWFGLQNVEMEKSVSAGDVRHIRIESGSTDVEVVQGNSDEIVARLHGKASKNRADSYKLDVQTQGDTTRVDVDREVQFGFSFQWTDVKLTAELPERVWQTFAIETGSADIDVRQIVSGQIELKVGSGDIDMETYTADKISFDVGSGDVRLTNGYAALTGETSSGDISIRAEKLQGDVDLKTGSGDVAIQLGQDPQSLAVDFQAGSGEGTVKWSGMKAETINEKHNIVRGTFGSGETKLKIRTGSGDFVLK